MWQGHHSLRVLVSIPWWCCFSLFLSYFKVSICMVRVALWCQHRPCLCPADFGVTALLSQGCSARLRHIANHCYSLVSKQKSLTSPQKRVTFVESLAVHRPSRLRIGRGRGRSFVSLSRGFVAPRLRSRCFRIRSLWTASIEHADVHPTVFLTARAFYGGGSGLLWESDLRSSRRSRLLVYLFTLRLPSTETPRLHISEPFLDCLKP